MTPGETLGTWTIISRVVGSGRTRFNVRCIHCRTERQIRLDQLSQCAPWHKGCLVVDSTRTRRYSTGGGSEAYPGNHPQWARWSAELHMHPELAETWPPSRVESIRFWRQNLAAPVMSIEERASLRYTGRSVVP